MKIPTLDKATMAAVVAAAHARGKLAVAHIGSLGNARDAIAAGVDGLAHLFVAPMPDADFGAFAAAHHVFVVPTLTVLHSICDPGHGARVAQDARLSEALDPDGLASLRAGVPFVIGKGCAAPVAAIDQLLAAGVPILAGTDAPNSGTAHGASLHDELALLVAAGLTPEQALTAATAAPARAFHLDDRGRIAPGLRADLLLVQGDPTVDITATRNIVGVWHGGQPMDRQLALASRARERAAAAETAASPLAGGPIGSFDDGKMTSSFGAGWDATTDTIAGGTSSSQLTVVPGGATGSARALHVKGTIVGPLPYAWSGTAFFPGKQRMDPVNLVGLSLHFWCKGDGATYRLLFFTRSGGPRPYGTTFVAGPTWHEEDVPLAKIPGLDAKDVIMILWVGGPTPGPFELWLDELSLTK
jgi:hypothetical protein